MNGQISQWNQKIKKIELEYEKKINEFRTFVTKCDQ